MPRTQRLRARADGGGDPARPGLSHPVVMRRVEKEKAKALLSDSETELSHLAAQIGFRTQGHFTGVFRRYTGYTPGAFRLDCRQSS